MYNLCLNMIVKNEEENILNTLKNLTNYIKFDYWVICDTGSIDNTKNIILEFFKNKNIKGKIYDDKWVNFSYNRNLAIEKAEKLAKYLFFFDADDMINGNLIIPKNLEEDGYNLIYGDSFHWYRTNIICTKYKWRYKGILHETIHNLSKKNINLKVLYGDYYISGNCNGYRSKNKNKYYLDAMLLEREILLNNEPELLDRYTFYCAQSYKDANCIDKSIEYYEKVIEQNNWNQEKYYSALMLGNLYLNKNMKDKALHYYFLTNKYDNSRVEGIYMCHELLINSLTEELQLKLLTCISCENYADPHDNKYLFIQSDYHNIYYINKIVKLSFSLKYYFIGYKYLLLQLSRYKKLKFDDIIINLQNIKIIKENIQYTPKLEELNNLLFNYLNTLKIYLKNYYTNNMNEENIDNLMKVNEINLNIDKLL